MSNQALALAKIVKRRIDHPASIWKPPTRLVDARTAMRRHLKIIAD